MGTWGMKVEENDAYADIYEAFFESYNSGTSPEYATKKLLESHAEYFDDYEDSYNSWFALAYAQWETQSLQKEIFEKSKAIISNADDLRLFKELGARDKDIAERKLYLEKFLDQISTPRKSKKRRVRKKVEFRTERLVELLSPDKKKSFTVAEEFSDGIYVHTSALMMWESGGGSVFYFTKQGAKVSAEWVDSNILNIVVEKDIKFDKQDTSAFYCGDEVSVSYKYR